MLTRGGKPEDESPYSVKTYLVHCVTAATSIIAIFDLFCRTFSMNYCVLSLAYSVYIAASIFLLQVQAAPDDEQALRRLDYCIKSLEQVKIMSPGKMPCDPGRNSADKGSHRESSKFNHEGAVGAWSCVGSSVANPV